MRKYFAAYIIWLLGVLSAAAVALYYYRRILAMGDAAITDELGLRPPGSPEATSPRPEVEPTFEDTEDIEEARPPSFEDMRRRRSGGSG